MANSVYRLGGIDIESELPLPASPCTFGAAPTAWIRRGTVAATLPNATLKRALCEAGPSEFHLTIPGTARYQVRGGTEIIVDEQDNAASCDVTTYLATYAFAALCHQRQLLVLHATAVNVDGTAALFLGQSASGKSTLGADLAVKGHGIMCDDVCVVDTSGERALIHPAFRRLGLWSDALDHLGCRNDGIEPYISSLQKFSVRIGPVCTLCVPMSCLFLIEEARLPLPAIELTELKPVEAIAAVAAQTFMPFLVTALSRQDANFHQCGRALMHASVFRMSRRWGFQTLRDASDHAERLARARTR